jgi:hypothetical protein
MLMPLPVVPGAFLHRPSGEMNDAMCYVLHGRAGETIIGRT